MNEPRIIDGLKVTVPGDTVKEWCEEAYAKHAERALFYAAQVLGLRDGGVISDNNSGDPLSALEARQRDHRAKAEWFSLISAYIDTSAVFVLTDYDLQKLERGARQ